MYSENAHKSHLIKLATNHTQAFVIGVAAATCKLDLTNRSGAGGIMDIATIEERENLYRRIAELAAQVEALRSRLREIAEVYAGMVGGV